MHYLKTQWQRLGRRAKATLCTAVLASMTFSVPATAAESADLHAYCFGDTCIVLIFIFNPATGQEEWTYMTTVSRSVWEGWLRQNMPE